MMKKVSRFGTPAALFILGLFMIAGFQNCGAGGFEGEVTSEGKLVSKSSKEEVDELYQQVRALAEQDLSCAQDSDCEALAIGAQACGGPRSFIPVSSKSQVLAQLNALAAELEVKEKAYNDTLQMASICMMLMPPKASCVANRCAF